MPPKHPLPIAAMVLRVLLGAWFALTGGEKLFVTGLSKFTRDVANYGILKAPWDAVAAYTIPWFELVAGIFLMLGLFRKGALLTIAGLVMIFAGGVAHAWHQGLDIACGCRGGTEPMNYTSKAVEFAGYFIVIAFIAFIERRDERKALREEAPTTA